MTFELFIEKWSSPTGGCLYPWSVWKDGKQVHYGQRHTTPEQAETEGLQYCQQVLGEPPARVTHL